MRRRRRALGAPRHIHAERAEADRVDVQVAVASVHAALDTAGQGDAHSCSTALRRLLEASDAHGSARANDRATSRGSSESREIHAAMDRYKKVCQASRCR